MKYPKKSFKRNLSGYAPYEFKEGELLSNAREELNPDARAGMYREFQEILSTKMPAIFLYSPQYIYVQRKSVQGFSALAINTPASRFQDVAHWYMNTKRVRK